VGTTGSATFNITLSNLDLSDLQGHHIHNAISSTNGPIVIDFGDPDSIRSGSILSGTLNNLPAATITNVFANPTSFYYIGVVVPEPASLGLLGCGAALMLLRRRRVAV
jgi:hypothetical protein